MSTLPSRIKLGYAASKRGQIHFAEAGSGSPLLLLSETPRTHRYFLRIMPHLAQHFRVIAMDTPGFGNSHALPEPTTIPALADCVCEFLDALGLERTSVLGVHTGDKVAAAFAANYPARLDRLILAGQSHSLIPDSSQRNEALRPSLAHYHSPDDGAFEDDLQLFKSWAGAQATATELWWPGNLLKRSSTSSADVESAERQVIDYLLGWRSPFAIYRAVFAFDLAEAMQRICAPTLVLELISPEEKHIAGQAERLCKLMASATPASLPVTYLSAFQQQPVEIANIVTQFLLGRTKNPATNVCLLNRT